MEYGIESYLLTDWEILGLTFVGAIGFLLYCWWKEL